MKEVIFGLRNAGWPSFLVNAAGKIIRANLAAEKLFGSALEQHEAPLLSAIWPPESTIKADQFLAQWERSPSPTVSLRFRIKGGTVNSFATAICAVVKDEEKIFIFQLLPETGH